ncbi:MAG: hypothetical protein KAU50_01325 [Candidatus Marinimicrobia bacterium]|nr:hypothetical protein [Candidatus Neomarinimicrobiota bacterium]
MGPQWKYSITIKDEERVEHAAQFEDDEWVQLQLYEEYAAELKSTRFVSENGPQRLNLSYSQESGFAHDIEMPDKEKVISLMHRLRPFILNDEKTNFSRICNIITKCVSDDKIRSIIKSQKIIFTGKQLQSLFKIESNSIVINSDETLNMWLYAFEYHRDMEKREQLLTLTSVLPLDVLRAFMIMMLSDKTRAIINVNAIIRLILGKEKRFRILF